MEQFEIESILGKKQGSLTFFKFLKRNTKKVPVYLMKCDCGGEREMSLARSNSLLKTCGKCPGNKGWRNGLVAPLDKIDQYSTLRNRYKRDANARGFDFNLSQDEFEELVLGECYYCGSYRESSQKYNNRGRIYYTGIDRVDNAKGYSKQNCVSCCKVCNVTKKAVTKDIIKKAYEFLFKDIDD